MKYFLNASLYIVLTLYFLNLINKDIYDFSLISNLKNLVIIVATVIGIFFMYGKNIKIKTNNSLKMIFIMISIILIHSTIFSEDVGNSLLRTVQLIFIICYIIMIVNILGNKQVLIILQKYFFVIIIIIIILSDYLIFIGDIRIFSMGNFRSFFNNSNTAGAYIGLFLLPFIAHKLFEISSKKLLFLYIPIFINLFIILIFTNSRGAVLSFTAIIIFLIYYKYIVFHVKSLRNMLIIIGFMLVSMGIIGSNNNFLETIARYVVKHDSLGDSEHSRSFIWNERIIGIEDRPLLGWGYGINSNVYLSIDYDLTTEKGSSFLAILEEFGLIFGFIIICILITLMYILLNSIKQHKVYDLRLILVSILIGSIINAFFESWILYFGNINTFIFWLILILLINSVNEKKMNA